MPYDFTSGGRGIFNGKPPSTPGFQVASLNGNLQIADLTSVAVDPVTAGQYYITTLGLAAPPCSTPPPTAPPAC